MCQSTSTPAIDTATVWTSDLTHDYVEENSAYSS
jgi:N-acetylglutamate synthase/N-acetylornithine aminotransferase